MLAIMAGTLPRVIAQFGGAGQINESAMSHVIETADGLLLDQVRELSNISTTQRHRYWHCLLEAMIEDEAIHAPQGEARAVVDKRIELPMSSWS